MDNFITTEEVASRLHLHQNTVIRYIQQGKLPAVKVGKGYRIKESALAAFVGETNFPNAYAKVLAVANHKGGVAKTTTSVNLAACLGATGKRVLLVDVDAQGGCAICLGIDTYSFPKTMYDVLVDPATDIDRVVLKTNFGFDLAPANIDLAGADVELRQILAQESVLKRRLQPVIDKYDYIIIDTPPNLGILTVNALTAAEYVVIPVSCELMALRGLRVLLDTVANVREVTNPDLKILGMLTTKYDGRTINSREIHDYLTKLCEREGIRLFDQVIKLSVRFMEAPNHGTPLVQLHPDLDGAKAYVEVAEEIDHGS